MLESYFLTICDILHKAENGWEMYEVKSATECKPEYIDDAAFQYSLHYLESENVQLKHKEYLAKEGQDPRRELAQRLVDDIPKNVYTMAYNMQFEKMVIARLAGQFEDLSEHLMNIHQNMIDLMVPFQKKHYYQKEMKGSYSIKYVLPTLFPDDGEMNYKRLNIQNGSMAMEIFATLHLKDGDEIEQIRRDLLEYCKLDTLAMVRVWEKLRGTTKLP